MGLIDDRGLTIIDKDFEAKRRMTWPGMAHFAGTGPAGKTCRQCDWWTGCGDSSGYYAIGGVHHGAIKPRACERYRDLMGEMGAAIPHDAVACSYFVENTSPPAPVRKKDV